MEQEEHIERMIEVCLETLEEHPERFSSWEIDFLESVEEYNEMGHLTEGEGGQLEKLEEIYEERCLDRD